MPERDEELPLSIPKTIEPELRHRSDDLRLRFLEDLLRYAYARLGSLEDAEDVAIEVLQAAVNVKGGLESIREPKLYLLGIARRKVADTRRRSRRERGPDTLAIADLQPISLGIGALEISTAVRQVLAKLPESYQEVLVLKYVHGLTAEEIATVIGKSNAAARSLVQRARQAFVEQGAHLVEDRA